MFTNLAIPKRQASPGRLPQFQPDRELLWQAQAMGPLLMPRLSDTRPGEP